MKKNFWGTCHSLLKHTSSDRSDRLNRLSYSKAGYNRRLLRIEELEERQLLTVTAGEYAEIQTTYTAFGLPELANDTIPSNTNIIEVTDLSITTLKAAIATASTTTSDDLIVLRTTDESNRITFANAEDEIAINFNSSQYGKLSIIAFGTKSLTIDANQLSRVINITDTTVNLANLTITGGYNVSHGGGIYGGTGSTLTLTNCLVDGNQTYGDNINGGAGIYSLGNLTILDSVISNNNAGGKNNNGGGITHSTGILVIRNSEILNNTSTNYGGGVDHYLGIATLTNVTITGNKAKYSGGIYNNGNTAQMEIIDCLISNNTATTNGGGIYNNGGSLEISECVIVGNKASNGSGGYVESGTLVASNVTITGNYGEYGLLGNSNASIILNNSIIALNMTPTYSAKNISGNIEKNNIILDNPLFIVAPKWNSAGEIINFDEMDLRLRSDSTAIDAGNNEWVVSDTDFYRGSRIYNGTVDIGAYEYQGEITNNSLDYHTVTTLTDKFDQSLDGYSLREALFYAPKEETVRFSEELGGNINLQLGKLIIDNNCKIDGNNKIAVNAGRKSRVADISGSQVQLTGLEFKNGYLKNASYAGLHSTAASLIITDCQIVNCSAERVASGWDGNTYYGGGIYATGNLSLYNSTVTQCSAGGVGGGIFMSGSELMISNSVISFNSSVNHSYNASGGGIYANNNVDKIVIENSYINDNKTHTGSWSSMGSYVRYNGQGGGILYNGAGVFDIKNSFILNNSINCGGGGGGGIATTNSSCVMTITDVLISGNSATGSNWIYGGGIYTTATTSIVNSSITDNISGCGGGIYNNGTIMLFDCTIEDNTAVFSSSYQTGSYLSSSGGGIYNGGTANITLCKINQNICTSSGTGNSFGGGIYNYSGTLTATNTTLARNTSKTGGGD